MTKEQEFEFRYRLEQEAEAGLAPQTALATKPSAQQTREQRLKSMPASEFYAGLPISRFAMGVASPVLAAGQLLGGERTRATIGELEAAKQRGMEGRGEEGTDWLGYLGAMVPATAVASGISKALPAATSLLGRMGTGAAVGGGIAATTPVTEGRPEDFWFNKALQTGAGAVLGGTIPAAVEGVKAVGGVAKRAVEPLYEKGRAAVLKRYQEGLLGQDATAKAKVVQALQQAQEIVPGSKPTAGEAIAQIPEATGLAAHQRQVSRMEGVSPEFAQRSAEQEVSRRGAIGGIAKTPQALEDAIEKRTVEAAEKYGAAGKQVVKADDAFRELLQRPSMKHILGRAKDLAQEQGKAFQIVMDQPEQTVTSAIVGPRGEAITKTIPATSAEYPVESLHYMKMAMDDLIKNPERFGIGASEARAIGGTQRQFLEWLGQKSPAYSEARTAFAKASEPINRMQVGQELQKALQAPLGTSERAAGFAGAMREAPRTLKKATGQPRFEELSEVLTPAEQSNAQAVAQELARKDAFQRLAAKTTLPGGGVIPGNVGVPLPNLLSRPAMLANFLMRQAGQSAEQKIGQLAGQQYLNPQMLATLLQDVPTPQRQAVIEAIMKRAGVPLTLGAAREF